ncbi:outer membrane protein assembly factor BamB family protein [Roseimaritima sediminicola]|uniref:outer membrane protein assembly factor BamB family protein n=1 Tax=Roseimaritima sediminicola TaxID=2662066 RepID=UPI0012984F8B|nr:PQQ-binding-like beta-propeller repeat protein [Roseimaritima sediminicola]
MSVNRNAVVVAAQAIQAIDRTRRMVAADWTIVIWLAAGVLTLLAGRANGADDWPQWRGAASDNHAPLGASPPQQWDLSSGHGVVWKTPVPGAGHSSPTVFGNRIYLSTAEPDQDQQRLLQFDRESGELIRAVVVHQGGLPKRIHPHNTHASPTVATDGELVFVVFHNDGAIRATAFDNDLRQVWQSKVADFTPAAFQFGYGASPVLYRNHVIIAAEYDGPDSGLYALDKANGRQAWKVARPANLSFSSPVVAMLAGKDQLLLPGADAIQSFDPVTGRRFWSAEASTEATCGTVVWDDRSVFVSGGNPRSGTWAVRADGTEELIWENSVMCYEQSLLADRGYVYAVSDAGVAYCWKADNGTEMWKRRLGGGFSASPLLVDDRIYAASEDGEVFVYRATPDRFVLLAKNRLGDEIFATPVALGDRLYVRYAVMGEDGRQEYLAALGDHK